MQEALLGAEYLDIEYRSLQDATFVTRRIAPRALLHKGQVTYVVATRETSRQAPHLRPASDAQCKAHGISAPRADFDLDPYLAREEHEPGLNTPITLEARINANLAKILRETPLNAS